MSYRHALCINPYLTESAAAMGFFPPTGLEYVASAIASRTPRVTLVDLRHEPAFADPARMSRFVEREGVDLIGISANWHFGFDRVKDLIRTLPPDVFTIVGGQEATVRVEELFESCPNVDCVVRGEGETPAREIAGGMPLADVPGASFRSGGEIRHNESAPSAPVSALPQRDRSLRRVSYGLEGYGVTILSGGFDTVLTSRGCPYSCKFCSFNKNPFGAKRDYDERPAEDVFEELTRLDADIVYFADDNFFVNQKRVEQLCDMIIASGMRKRFIAQARLELARNPVLLGKLVSAGFKVLLLGIESAQDRILAQLNKGFTRRKISEYFRVFRRFPIYYHGYFIYGNIGETEAEMMEIPRFARSLGLDSISVLKLEARRFTQIRDIVNSSPGYHIDPSGFVFSDKYSMKNLKRIGSQIKRDFYTPIKLARSVAKMLQLDVMRAVDLIALPFRLPRGLVSWRLRLRRMRRARAKGAAS